MSKLLRSETKAAIDRGVREGINQAINRSVNAGVDRAFDQLAQDRKAKPMAKHGRNRRICFWAACGLILLFGIMLLGMLVQVATGQVAIAEGASVAAGFLLFSVVTVTPLLYFSGYFTGERQGEILTSKGPVACIKASIHRRPLLLLVVVPMLLLASCDMAEETVDDPAEVETMISELWDSLNNSVKYEGLAEEARRKRFEISGIVGRIDNASDDESDQYHLLVEQADPTRLAFSGIPIPVVWVAIYPEASKAELAELEVGDPIVLKGSYADIGKWEGELFVRVFLQECETTTEFQAKLSHAEACNEKAWSLATIQDASSRDGQEAVRLATMACEVTDWREHNYVDTLAAAYAEAGDFAQAIEMQQEAIRLGRDTDLESEYRDRLRHYKAGSPYRDGMTTGLAE